MINESRFTNAECRGGFTRRWAPAGDTPLHSALVNLLSLILFLIRRFSGPLPELQ